MLREYGGAAYRHSTKEPELAASYVSIGIQRSAAIQAPRRRDMNMKERVVTMSCVPESEARIPEFEGHQCR